MVPQCHPMGAYNEVHVKSGDISETKIYIPFRFLEYLQVLFDLGVVHETFGNLLMKLFLNCRTPSSTLTTTLSSPAQSVIQTKAISAFGLSTYSPRYTTLCLYCSSGEVG